MRIYDIIEKKRDGYKLTKEEINSKEFTLKENQVILFWMV